MTDEVVAPKVKDTSPVQRIIFSESTRADAVADVKAGMTNKDAAKKYNTTPASVGKWVKADRGEKSVKTEKTAKPVKVSSLTELVKRVSVDPKLTAQAVTALKKILQDDLDSL